MAAQANQLPPRLRQPAADEAAPAERQRLLRLKKLPRLAAVADEAVAVDAVVVARRPEVRYHVVHGIQ